jgi:hypothetical protein
MQPSSTYPSESRAAPWLHWAILRDTLDVMSPGERSRLNSPITARQRVEKVLKARDGAGEETVKTSPLAVMKKRLVELTHENEHLKEQLAATELRSGSLFDLKRDKAEDIVGTIIANVTSHKAETIAKALLVAVKKPKPAG